MNYMWLELDHCVLNMLYAIYKLTFNGQYSGQIEGKDLINTILNK